MTYLDILYTYGSRRPGAAALRQTQVAFPASEQQTITHGNNVATRLTRSPSMRFAHNLKLDPGVGWHRWRLLLYLRLKLDTHGSRHFRLLLLGLRALP